MSRLLLTKPASEVTAAEHMAHCGYVSWRPRNKQSNVLVKWYASNPWGPWHMANPEVRKRPLPKRQQPIASAPSSAGVVGRY